MHRQVFSKNVKSIHNELSFPRLEAFQISFTLEANNLAHPLFPALDSWWILIKLLCLIFPQFRSVQGWCQSLKHRFVTSLILTFLQSKLIVWWSNFQLALAFQYYRRFFYFTSILGWYWGRFLCVVDSMGALWINIHFRMDSRIGYSGIPETS